MSLATKKWGTLSQKVLVNNQFISVREDVIQRPDGKEGRYYVVELNTWSVIIPKAQDKLYMVRQYRYPVGSVSVEFPMGHVPNKSPEEIARIELSEETGIRADTIEPLGSFWSSTANSNSTGHIFLAEGLHFEQAHPEEGEFVEMVEYSIAQVREMIAKGEILDGATIVAFHFLEQHLAHETS